MVDRSPRTSATPETPFMQTPGPPRRGYVRLACTSRRLLSHPLRFSFSLQPRNANVVLPTAPMPGTLPRPLYFEEQGSCGTARICNDHRHRRVENPSVRRSLSISSEGTERTSHRRSTCALRYAAHTEIVTERVKTGPKQPSRGTLDDGKYLPSGDGPSAGARAHPRSQFLRFYVSHGGFLSRRARHLPATVPIDYTSRMPERRAIRFSKFPPLSSMRKGILKNFTPS
ncbi:hypothetical protein EVAR_32307_1 [Eumeta japonica]|uniref:Uncharacterized protein n=1 Tax=Eumeta variegata TaxID=151549 RepID=A0A4C1WDI3_EUMVA|nr:hypothetical protein EVAR_32307_1 [Eumeta japonica]